MGYMEKEKCTHVMPQCKEILFQCIDSCSIVVKLIKNQKLLKNIGQMSFAG